MKGFLQGHWLKHPLHPALVHIPMSLWPIALLCDLIVFFAAGSDDTLRSTLLYISFFAISLGLLVALLAIPAGLADWWDIKTTNPARNLGLVHLAINSVVFPLWAANLVLRIEPTFEGGAFSSLLVWLSGLATALLIVSGYLGGRMVYEYGISVARQSKDKWRQIAEAGGGNLPPRQ